MGYVGTNTQEECSLRPWCLIGLGTEGMQELLLPWAAFLGVVGPHLVCTKLHLNDNVSHPISLQKHCFRVIQPSALGLKFLISPANVYYPFFLMHYYVLILHETEKETIR